MTEEERERLATEHLPWVIGFARWWASRRGYGRHLDEFESAAGLGLAKAVERYDPKRGDFKSFVTHQVLGAVRDVVRTPPLGTRRGREHRRVDEVELLVAFSDPRDDDRDILASDEPPVGWELEWEETVERVAAMAPCSRSQREILRRRFLRADLADQRRASWSVGLCETSGGTAIRSLRHLADQLEPWEVAS